MGAKARAKPLSMHSVIWAPIASTLMGAKARAMPLSMHSVIYAFLTLLSRSNMTRQLAWSSLLGSEELVLPWT